MSGGGEKAPGRVDYLVAGLGAVGSAVAVALAGAGARVAAVTRRAGGCRWRRVTVEGLGGAVIPVCGWRHAAGMEAGLLVYAVKAYQLPAAVEEAEAAGLRVEAVAGLQNGLGSLELLEEVYGAHRAGAGIVYFGATRLPGGTVRLSSGGRVLVGCRRPPCSPWLRRFADMLAGRIQGVYVGDVEPHRWLKLAVNAAVNPVTVLAWGPNRVVAEDPWARALAERLAGEAGRVAEEAGLRLPRDPVEAALAAAEATGDNCSSMLQDVAAGRETEIDYINGAVASTARRLGSAAPFNEAVAAAVRLAAPGLRGRRLPCQARG